MESRAVLKYIRSSPRKMRIIVDQIRGKRVPEAMNILHYLPHRASKPIEATVQSAVHNLMDRYSEERFDDNELFIHEVFVDEAPTFKRIRPAPRGRAHRVRKRTSHLTIVVGTERQAAGVTEEMEASAT